MSFYPSDNEEGNSIVDFLFPSSSTTSIYPTTKSTKTKPKISTSSGNSSSVKVITLSSKKKEEKKPIVPPIPQSTMDQIHLDPSGENITTTKTTETVKVQGELVKIITETEQNLKTKETLVKIEAIESDSEDGSEIIGAQGVLYTHEEDHHNDEIKKEKSGCGKNYYKKKKMAMCEKMDQPRQKSYGRRERSMASFGVPTPIIGSLISTQIDSNSDDDSDEDEYLVKMSSRGKLDLRKSKSGAHKLSQNLNEQYRNRLSESKSKIRTDDEKIKFQTTIEWVKEKLYIDLLEIFKNNGMNVNDEKDEFKTKEAHKVCNKMEQYIDQLLELLSNTTTETEIKEMEIGFDRNFANFKSAIQKLMTKN